MRQIKIINAPKITDAPKEYLIEWYADSSTASVSLPRGPLATKIKKKVEKMPDQITELVCNADGSIFCHIPLEWVKIDIPRPSRSANQKATVSNLNPVRKEEEAEINLKREF